LDDALADAPRRPVLILGGSAEARSLAAAAAGRDGWPVISSLAGRVGQPHLPVGEVRIGGFGGVDGLAAYVRDRRISALVDATHPFAAGMGWNAARACAVTGVPLLRLDRPAWTRGDGDRWIEVDDWPQAAAIVASRSRRVLLAIGRQELAPFAGLDRVWFLIRAVEPPDPLPAFRRAGIVSARGPFALEDERALLCSHRIDTIVCKNSGGAAAAAKLAAARELGVTVVMRRRPPRPAVPAVASVGEAVAWLRENTL